MTIHVRQAEIEREMKERGVQRTATRVEKAKQKGALSETPGGVAMTKRLIEPAANAIAEHMVNEEVRRGPKGGLFKHAGHLDPYVLAYVSMRVAIDQATNRNPLLRCVLAIGTAVEDELRLEKFEAANEGLYGAISRTLRHRGTSTDHARATWSHEATRKEIEVTRLTRNERIQIGMELFGLVMSSTGMFETPMVPVGHDKWQYHVALAAEAEAFLAARNEAAGLLRPQYLPTVVPPKPWEETRGGGYYTDALFALPVVKRTFRSHVEKLKEATSSGQMAPVYRGLNAIQNTAWVVNQPVLTVLKDAWDRGLRLDYLPNREDLKVPERPVTEDEERIREWKKEARDIHEANALSRCHRLEFDRILSLAERMQHDPAIYFPHQLDFRGRCYAVPAGLNPQGADHAKALLTFAEAKPLDARGAWWLAVHGANVYGNDKVSLDERAAWGIKNAERAVATATDPLADLWWTEADKPGCFLAWCFEIARARTDGMSSLPIALDGSCNGLQHFSAMLRDPVGGAAVNLIPSDKPQDIYGRVAERTVELLRMEVHAGGEKAWMAHAWVAFGIDRSITKRPVMVLPYGGTRISCMDYVREAVKKKLAAGQENPFGDELKKATTYLATVIWDAIGDVVIAARAAMGWLQQAARIAAKAGLPITWTTPSGFVAHQEYRDMKSRLVKTRMRGSIIRLQDRQETEKMDPSRQALAMSPNFVHSLDAAAMMLTIGVALDRGITQFAMIHDSYGTVAADTDKLASALRFAFVQMYHHNDVLAQFAEELKAQLPSGTELPPLPPKGALDIHAVLESAYFFA